MQNTADLRVVLKAQEKSLAGVRRAVKSCGEELAVLCDCLRDAGVLSQSRFSVQLHRHRFAAARAAHGLVADAGLQDVLGQQDLALAVGLSAGPRAVGQVAAASREVGKAAARGVLAAVREGCPQDIYVISGGDGSRILGSLERFAPGAGTWELLPLTAEPRVSAAAAAVAGRLFVIGGWHGRHGQQQPSRTMERFDPAAGVWEDMPPMSVPRGGAASAAAQGRLYVCGGFDGGMQPLDSAECFAVAAGVWEALPPMLGATSSAVAAALGGALYVCGGYDSQLRPRVGCERLPLSGLGAASAASTAATGWASGWVAVADMAESRAGAAAATIARRLYVCGGHSGGGALRSAECFVPEAGIWEDMPAMLVGRCNAAFAVTGGRLYVFGGRGGIAVDSAARLSSAEVFDPRRGEWSALPPMSERRTDATAVATW